MLVDSSSPAVTILDSIEPSSCFSCPWNLGMSQQFFPFTFTAGPCQQVATTPGASFYWRFKIGSKLSQGYFSLGRFSTFSASLTTSPHTLFLSASFQSCCSHFFVTFCLAVLIFFFDNVWPLIFMTLYAFLRTKSSILRRIFSESYKYLLRFFCISPNLRAVQQNRIKHRFIDF